MPTIEFQGDDTPALDYIRKRGYASYSSIKNVRDKVVPEKSDAAWFKFGGELHSRDLEKKKLEKLSADQETQLAEMLATLDNNLVYQQLKKGAIFEIDFGPRWVLEKFKSKNGIVVPHILGVPVYGRIDILHPQHIGDLKSTKETTLAKFVDTLDFLQAALYLKAVPRKTFYYPGISKQKPYKVLPFSVHEYPLKLKKAETEMVKLLTYIKSKL